MHTDSWITRRLGVLACAVLAVCALAACGSSSSGSSGAQNLIKQTFSGSHTVKSGVLNFALTLNPSGSSTLTTPLSLSLSGPFQSRGSGKLPQSNFTVDISALGRHGALGVVSTGSAGYVSLQGASYQLPAADFQRLDSSFSSVESSSGSGGGLSGLGINPTHWLKNPSVVGDETVGGADTTHVRAGVDVAALLSDLNTFLAKTAKTTGTSGKLPTSIPSSTAQKISAAIKNATVDIWTGKTDKTLRKLSLNLTVPVSGQISSLLGGLKSAGIGLTISYANLNQPQTISAPSNVQPYSQFQTKLRSIVSALEGGLAGGSSAGGSTGSSTAPSTSGSSSSVSKYSQCIQSAGQDVTKMQKCASLLNGSNG